LFFSVAFATPPPNKRILATKKVIFFIINVICVFAYS
jgi:hypothetical protein